ncbi:CBS domain-containing protein [Alkaliphilus hydrothermalis]|uniref:CBS domain-containing protein n=1 Tax=Alkaliphilus hydrothermalis TaxID=1482730 RepID=A0ABS2NMW7_9FIRM|nr:CBS domain-containing protein [Alkaliphilus hydrothermalis]MBM7614275.1 CBS domain-containing protein [Alkaliphilus hydrothermalis]
MKVKEIMTTEVITTKKDNTVEDVIKLLVDHNISGIPVVDDENYVVGIITEGDIIYRSKKLRIPSYFTILDSYIFLDNPNTVQEQIKKMVGYKVEDVMSDTVIVVKEDETVEEVATIITHKKVNRLPVVKDGKLVGIVSRRDIIKAYSKS